MLNFRGWLMDCSHRIGHLSYVRQYSIDVVVVNAEIAHYTIRIPGNVLFCAGLTPRFCPDYVSIWKRYAQRTADYAFGVAGDRDLARHRKLKALWKKSRSCRNYGRQCVFAEGVISPYPPPFLHRPTQRNVFSKTPCHMYGYA